MKPKVTVGDDGKVSLVTINMGKPFTDRAQIPMEGPSGPVIDEPIDIDGKTYKITSLLMGVPHTIRTSRMSMPSISMNWARNLKRIKPSRARPI